MTRTVSLLAIALLVAFVAGCSATDSRSDAERIAGVRIAETVNARVIGLSVPLADLTQTEPQSTVTFGPGDAFRLALTLPDSIRFESAGVTVPLPDAVTIVGTYALDEDANRVVITRTDIMETLTLQYAFRGSDDLELIAQDDATFGALIGVVAGPDYQALARVIDGGSIRFTP